MPVGPLQPLRPRSARSSLPGQVSHSSTLTAGASDIDRGGGDGSSEVDTGPKSLPSGVNAGTSGDVLGSGNGVRQAAEFGDYLSARTTSGVKRSIVVEGRAAAGNGGRDGVSGNGRGGLADGGVAGGGCGVDDGDGASIGSRR